MSSTWKDPFALQMSLPISLTSSVSNFVFSPPTRPSTPVEMSLPSSPTHHSRYYIQDDIAIFLVDDHLFRVHRYFLDRESQIFPKGNGWEPIDLAGVTRPEFESLLDFFYDGMHNETATPLSAWTAILSISTRFQMGRVRVRAINEISNFWPRIDPADQVVLAVKHNVPEWLPLAYAVLCQRDDPIEVEEAKKLGLETTVLLAKARERVRSADVNAQHNSLHLIAGSTRSLQACQSHSTNSDTTPFETCLVDHVIKEIFWPAPKLSEQEQGEPIAASEIGPIPDPVPDSGIPSDNAQAEVLTEIHNELNIFSCNLKAQETENRQDSDHVTHDARNDLQNIHDESREEKENEEENWRLRMKAAKKKKGKKMGRIGEEEREKQVATSSLVMCSELG